MSEHPYPPSVPERHIRVAGVVNTIEEAFAFIIGHMDAEQMAAPVVAINPVWWSTDDDDMPTVLRFEVAVGGNVKR